MVKSKQDLLKDYLSSVVFQRESDSAFVDTGWQGTLQKSLSRIYTSEKSQGDIRFFYIGLKDNVLFDQGSTASMFIDGGALKRLGY